MVEIDTSPPVCPNCHERLDKRPTRKSKCPHCGLTIFVKYSPDDRVKRLVTAERNEEIEALWAAYNVRQAQLSLDNEGAMYGLAPGLTRESLPMHLKAVAKDASVDIQIRRMAAFQVSSASAGNDRSVWRIIGYRLELEQLLAQGFRRVKIRGGVSPCSSCAALVGTVYLTAEVKSRRPIPNPDCYQMKGGGPCCAFWAADIDSFDRA